jgi:hypothetical protein
MWAVLSRAKRGEIDQKGREREREMEYQTSSEVGLTSKK